MKPVRCEGEFDYWQGLAEHWESLLTIVNLEHDMEVSDEHVEALLECPYPLCSWAYQCHWVTTHLPHDVYAAGNGARDPHTHPQADYLQGGEQHAAWSAIGFVKITRTARIGPLRHEMWSQLELAVHDAVERPWHMHWNQPGSPAVVHHHW